MANENVEQKQEGTLRGLGKVLLVAVIVYFALKFTDRGKRKGANLEGQRYNQAQPQQMEQWSEEAYQEAPGGPDDEGWPASAYEEPPGSGLLDGYEPAERAVLVKEKIRLQAEIYKLRMEKLGLEHHRQVYPRERNR